MSAPRNTNRIRGRGLEGKRAHLLEAQKLSREGSGRCGGSRQKAVYLTRGGPKNDLGESAEAIVVDAICI